MILQHLEHHLRALVADKGRVTEADVRALLHQVVGDLSAGREASSNVSVGYAERTLGRTPAVRVYFDRDWGSFVRRCPGCDGARTFPGHEPHLREECGDCGGEGWLRLSPGEVRRSRRARKRTLRAIDRGWAPGRRLRADVTVTLRGAVSSTHLTGTVRV